MTKNNFNTGKFVASLLMIATLAMVTIPSSYEQSSTAKVLDPSSTTYAACLEKIEQDTHTKYASVNEQSAITSASNHDGFKSVAKNYVYSKGTIVSGWSLDPVNCTANLTDVTVQFPATDVAGHKYAIIVTEDPITYTAKNVVVMDASARHDNPKSNWSGYDMQGSATGTTAVYETTLAYHVPTANDPTGSFCGTTGAQQCLISIWSGTSVSVGGFNGLVQTGTDSYCKNTNCSSGRSYVGWLELYDSSGPSDTQFFCNTVFTPAASDSMTTQVTNQKKNMGLNSNYDLYLIDNTQVKTCDVLTQSFAKGDPFHGEYVIERPDFSGTYSKLPSFSTITGVIGTIYYGGTSHGIKDPFNSGTNWYTHYVMENGSPLVKNANATNVNSMSKFDFNWYSSTNTG